MNDAQGGRAVTAGLPGAGPTDTRTYARCEALRASREGVDHLHMDLVNRVTDAYLETAEGSEAARLVFLKGIWQIQSDIEATDRPYSAPDAAAAREALATGLPLFAVSAPSVPAAEYVDAVSRIARYASEMAGLPAEQAEALLTADFASAIDQHALDGAASAPDVFVANVASSLEARPDTPLTPATIAFVLISALVPFLTGPARKALDALGEAPVASGASACPVCGSASAMGRMGESTNLKGAERTLWCGVCRTEWGYERLRCVRCGSRNPDTLRYTHIEDDSAHRLHLCDECHGYSKFVFVDDLNGPASMIVEDAITTTLDAIASELGYTATGDGGASSC